MKNRSLSLLLTLSIICFCRVCCFSQTAKKISGDTSFWFNQQKDDSLKFGLSNLMYCNDSFHFRFSTEGHIIDIWSADGKVYHGSLFIYKFAYKGQLEGRPNPESRPLYDLKVLIDTGLSRKAFDLIKTVEAIPSEHAIKGWQDGLDGVEYVFQTSTPSTFNFRSYWTPTAQGSTVTAAKIIEKFKVDLDSLVAYNTNYRIFFHSLKPGAYTDGGVMVMTKLTSRQNAYYKLIKPYRAYLDSVRNRLNSYLTDTLSRILQKQNIRQVYCDIFIKLSKDNKLIKIKTASELTNKQDRQDFRLCRKAVAAAFKSIYIDFVHSALQYWKSLTVNTGGTVIVDDTSDYFATPKLNSAGL